MNVVWFKRDLRLEDNAALQLACEFPEPLLLVYILEPSLIENQHTSLRHVQFIKESLFNLNTLLKAFNTQILLVQDEVKPTFQKLHSEYNIKTVFSTQEIGISITYERDIEMAQWFEEKNIVWTETQCNGVIRGLKNRKGWSYAWKKYMNAEECYPNLDDSNLLLIDDVESIQRNFKIIDCKTPKHKFQKGGRNEAIRWADSFFQNRIFHYNEGISKPELSRKTCSRLSPYFAWGNLSIREIYKRAIQLKNEATDKRPINAFLARLRWQSHFIQKFEMEPRMEFQAVNRVFLELPQPKNERFIDAWKSGLTGYPLVDASVRALKRNRVSQF
ncbi:deoxyribodipyrimidine photo-lyase [Mesonia ostreae]|uniref:Deoxyribodipyrimidine photo-lyase n=1 Tax=Mesonia ostreae TaxID=861110 RepID=A0ABU2KE95_9FLAO|nr:deoxyribodipyrimidine photo-lyase [Mesonia ostreae]MDT0293019.1 deoxyribodipyrimidine photo-lyase [Mesonia ostreae]